MRSKPNFLHLLMVPILTLLVCNPLSGWLLNLSTFGTGSFLKSLGISTLLSYGLYLNVLRPHRRPHWLSILFAFAGAVTFSWLLTGALLWLASLALLFSLMRISILELDHSHLPVDLLAVAAGIGAATVLISVSLPAALAAFFLVQLIYEMAWMHGGAGFAADRFQDGYRTADRILKSLP